MPLTSTMTDSIPAMSAFVSSLDTMLQSRFRRYFESDAIRSTINDIHVADVVYPLRRPCDAYFIPVVGEFLVAGFSPSFVGHGETPETGREDWLLSVHMAFQKLLHKRPFEMTEEDHRTWFILSSRIDVTVFRNQTPIQVRQFGVISMARPYPQQIKWENGSYEMIRIDQVASPDFITFKPGQPIDAVVARDPLDFRLLRIVHIERRSIPSRLSREEEAELLESIGSVKTLPSGGWQ